LASKYIPQNNVLDSTDWIIDDSDEKSPVNELGLMLLGSENLAFTIVIHLIDHNIVIVKQASPHADHRFYNRRGARKNQLKKKAHPAIPIGVEMEGTPPSIKDPHELKLLPTMGSSSP
jgi:hypothetical protein